MLREALADTGDIWNDVPCPQITAGASCAIAANRDTLKGAFKALFLVPAEKMAPHTPLVVGVEDGEDMLKVTYLVAGVPRGTRGPADHRCREAERLLMENGLVLADRSTSSETRYVIETAETANKPDAGDGL